MKSTLLPYLRSVKLLKLRTQTRARCVFPPSESRRLPVRFIIGCGRSGTTILGRVLSLNEQAMYLREPYHLWSMIDPRMDVTGLHSDAANTRFFMDADDLNEHAKRRFDLLISRSGNSSGHRCVIEKTPHNAGKIGWINAVEPGAKIVHIVRNGLSVVRSIDRLATKPTYKLGFKPNYNQWWGEHSAKWKAMTAEGAEHGYFSDEIGSLETNAQKGAYEWLVSLGEVDRWRDKLGDRLLEITYTQLTADPELICRLIADHVEVSAPQDWLDRARDMLSAERVNDGDDLVLPPKMAAQFNEYQERHSFAGRALSS